jgi:hypothetical protein
MATEPIFRIDRSTLVPLGLLVTVVLSAIGATLKIQEGIYELRINMMSIAGKVDSLGVRVDGMANGWWSYADMRAWVREAQARNAASGVTFPEPQQVTR